MPYNTQYTLEKSEHRILVINYQKVDQLNEKTK